MLTKNEIINQLKKEKKFLRENFYVTEIGLFGSFVQENADENSDIDLLVEIVAPLEIYKKTKEDLKCYLEKLFERSIDLANPNSLKPHYKTKILKQAEYA
ncbi:nucleotidyltransferase family protein [Moheibacter lacus]|uniref:Nucleotidyltransferase domain-containing protein n=1 Tax=Moheibacter lacus TaxID=2745851 RepID=A0A838ZTX0_9FLAO|nr:nucleotidyltransferase domain-containing protein [Moheibacter lacus]MBA5630440.1 nucleotidyltransferase domain-containing protein [Moheibacter lacus]